MQTQFALLVLEYQTAGNQRKMPNSGAPVIVRAGVRITVQIADLVRSESGWSRVRVGVREEVRIGVWDWLGTSLGCGPRLRHRCVTLSPQ